MAHGISGPSDTQPKSTITKAKTQIVIEDIVVQERTYIVPVPKLEYIPEEVHYEKPVITEKETIKYIKKEEDTTKYNVLNEDTIKYNPIDIQCEKPVVHDKVYEKPVIKEVPYEKPVIHEKIYEVHSVKNIDEVKSFIEEIKKLNAELPKLKAHLDSLKEYKLVEQVVRVPKLDFFTTKVERIEWVPVKREKEGLMEEGK